MGIELNTLPYVYAGSYHTYYLVPFKYTWFYRIFDNIRMPCICGFRRVTAATLPSTTSADNYQQNNTSMNNTGGNSRFNCKLCNCKN